MFRRVIRFGRRAYRVLAIETSCDDTAACLIRRVPGQLPVLEDHHKITLDSSKDGGIIPSDALAHHLHHIGIEVNELLCRNDHPSVDLVCATQGPGMFSSLAAGLQLAKGLAIAWRVPFIPVHHMLGHLLTPRFFAHGPEFPFLSLLVSGGHTMLVLSESLFQHSILANTIDHAVGNALDKCARQLGMSGIMLGRELDSFSTREPENVASLPPTLEIPLPLEKTHNGSSTRAAFSFAQYASLLPRIERQYAWEPLAAQPAPLRRAMGIQIQESMFTHLTRKMRLALRDVTRPSHRSPMALVCAGGVAANSRLRRHLTTFCSEENLELHSVDLRWCTDNALMIGWAGIELTEAGVQPDLGAVPRAKWPLEELTASNSA